MIDVGNKYNENGKNMQLEYSKKVLSKSPSCIGIKNANGMVLASLKPIVSKLHMLETDENIYKISENCYVTATGKECDIIYIVTIMKDIARQYKKMYNEEISGEYLKVQTNSIMNYFNSQIGARVLGCELIIMKKEKEAYNLYLVENDGSILRHKGCVIGSMQRRGKTEMEKINWANLSLEEMVDQVVMTFYKCYDPMVDKEFKLEIGVMGQETDGKFVRINQEDIDKYVEKYGDLTVDD